MNEEIIFKKNKLVLLSKLLKDVKNIYNEEKGRELETYKLRTQRKFLETIFEEEAVDKYINRLQNILTKHNLKKQINEEIINDDEV
jgi:hypothetical protein